eukprot:9417981-Lingulodinium_polyedra.AAC.1
MARQPQCHHNAVNAINETTLRHAHGTQRARAQHAGLELRTERLQGSPRLLLLGCCWVLLENGFGAA